MTLATAKMILASLLAMLSIWLYTASGLAQGGDDLPLLGQVYRFEQLAEDTRTTSVLDILQDTQGFLWFAGSIFADSQDNIWIGAWRGGLNYPAAAAVIPSSRTH